MIDELRYKLKLERLANDMPLNNLYQVWARDNKFSRHIGRDTINAWQYQGFNIYPNSDVKERMHMANQIWRQLHDKQ